MYPFHVSIRKIKKNIVILFSCLLLPTLAVAKDFRELYSLSKLNYVQSIYGKNIRAVLYEDIYPYLLPIQRKSLLNVKLNIPLFGHSAGLFEFYISKTGEMTIPALSVKFFDDMALAFTWYESKKIDRTKIIEYVARLYLKQDYMQIPLEALGVPEKAWKLNKYVDDVSQKILKSGLVYLLLHELGHWHYRHSPYNEISTKQAQEQEKQADSMALDVMGRMHIIPYGIVNWFLVTGLLQGNNPTTHPLSSERLYAIAKKIENNPAIFISQENRNTLTIQEVLSVAINIRIIADQINME